MKNVPNLITTLGIFLGLTSLYMINQGLLWLAFIFCITGMFCDLFDGYLARKFKVESKIGVLLDSVSDVILYLFFPIIIWYQMGISTTLLATFLVAGIFRLIRFGFKGYDEKENGLNYSGMPVFYNQLILAFTFAIVISGDMFTVIILVASVLMISNIKFVKPKIWQHISMLIIYLPLIGYGLWK